MKDKKKKLILEKKEGRLHIVSGFRLKKNIIKNIWRKRFQFVQGEQNVMYSKDVIKHGDGIRKKKRPNNYLK